MESKVALHIGVFDDSYLYIREAKALGYKVVATHPMDIVNKYYYQTVEDMIDEFHIIDYMDTSSLVDLAKTCGASMTVTHPCTNDASMAMARVNTRMGFNGIGETAAEHCASKEAWHQLLIEQNLPRPAWSYRYDEIKDLNSLEYPCIVKPNYGAGSNGIKKIDSAEELEVFMRERDRSNGWNLNKKYDYYLIQQYTHADYFSGVNCYVQNGIIKPYTHYARDQKSKLEQERLPYFYYEEGLFPSDPKFLTQEVLDILQHLANVLEIENGALRTEFFYDSDLNVINIIETNLRPGSSHTATSFHEIYGYNVTQELVKLNSKEHTSDFTRQHDTRFKYSLGKQFKFRPGVVESIEWPELNEHVHHFSSTLEPGSVIPDNWNASVGHQNGQLILLGESVEQVYQQLDQFTRKIRIVYK